MELYPIGVLSQKSGVSVKAIRYYSDIGLLTPVQTTASGYRLYGDREMTHLRQIAALRFLGASIQEVRKLMDDEKALLEFLAARAGVVDSEIERLGRLRKVISQARKGLVRREDPWRYLENVERVMIMTEEERVQWWEQTWRKMLGDSSLPAEFVDDYVADMLKSRKPENSENEMNYILAVENGEQDRYRREMNKKMARAKGMDVDQWEAKMDELQKRMHCAAKADPGDPTVQAFVDDWVSFFVGDNEADLKRALANFCEPFTRRMLTAGDRIKGDDRGEKIYQMILASMRTRLDDPGQ